ncbi:MAG: hypothetical protein FJZ89_13960 [Chloroflexi bacterium]|nr:hypothetical protein [Chloroflexota bacterium]
MNARERFLAVMNFEPADRTLKWEFGYWGGALRRWYAEGLPRRRGIPDDWEYGRSVSGEAAAWAPGFDSTRDDDVHTLLGLDTGLQRVPMRNLFCPVFTEEIVEEHGDWMVRRDEDGVLRREPKDRSSLPQFVGWPVHNRDDWERLKAERLQPRLADRWVVDSSQWLEQARQRDYPLAIGGGQGFFGTPRALLGLENLLLAYYDDPQFLLDINNDLANFWIALYDQVLALIDVDLALIWEDMCYKAGPLISPALFRTFLLPYYQRLTAFFREHGIKVILVDTDGNCTSLLPLFIEGGVTGLYPFEVNAGMDVVAVRQAFPHLQILGGIDKLQLAAGPAAIDAELAARVPALLRSGGYIPYVDHLVPPDVSWDNFRYYRQRLNEMIAA